MGKVTVKGMWKPSPTPADDLYTELRQIWINPNERRFPVQLVGVPSRKAWAAAHWTWSQMAH